MKVLVAGAGGFLGRAVVRGLVFGGHEVRGLVRRREQFDAIRHLGALPVLGDIATGEGLAEAVRGCEQAIHLAQPVEGDLADRRRVRVEGCRRLLAASRAEGMGRVLVGSGYWVYRSNPGSIVESSPIAPRSISQVNYETESVARDVARDGVLEFVYVRPGMVYGYGSWFLQIIRELRAGTYRYIGEGANRLSPVALEDVGAAFRTLAERGRAGETYLVVDDMPVATREFAEFVAERLRSPPPRSMTRANAVQEWGEDGTILEEADRAASNAKLRALGRGPAFSTYREGVPAVLREMAPD